MKIEKLNIEKLIIFMYIAINFYFGILIFNTKKYYSEFENLKVLLSNEVLLIVIFFNLFSFIFAYFLYKRIKIKLPFKNYTFSLNITKLNYFFFFITVIEIIFYLKTGIGKAGTYKKNNFSFLFNFFNLDSFFLFYYILARSKKSIYKLNIIMYLIFYIIRGWTGIILQIFILEGYYFLKKHKFKNRCLIYIFPILLIGGKIYQYLYALKFKIRLGINLKIDYFEGLSHLLERLSIINHSLVAIQNNKIIKELYYEQGIKYLEIKSFFRPFLPSILFKNKYFRCLGNLLMKSVYPTLSKDTSSGLGILSYIYNIFNLGLKEFLLWIIFFIIIFYLYLKIVMFFIKESSNKNLKILIFLWLLGLCNGGSLEMANYGWFRIYFLIVLFLIFKIITIKNIKILRKG